MRLFPALVLLPFAAHCRVATDSSSDASSAKKENGDKPRMGTPLRPVRRAPGNGHMDNPPDFEDEDEAKKVAPKASCGCSSHNIKGIVSSKSGPLRGGSSSPPQGRSSNTANSSITREGGELPKFSASRTQEGVFLYEGKEQRQNPITNDSSQKCIAMTKEGPCMAKARSAAVPYCEKHLKEGDPAMMMVKHERFGVSVTAARDLPKGYIAAMFGDLVKKEDMKSKNQEYGFQSSSGKWYVMPRTYERSYLQFAQCPGPSEKGVWTYAKKHQELIKPDVDTMGSFIYKTKRPVPKTYQLTMLYGDHEYEVEEFFRERGMKKGLIRCDVWQKANPTQLKDGLGVEDLQTSPEAAKKAHKKKMKEVSDDKFVGKVGKSE